MEEKTNQNKVLQLTLLRDLPQPEPMPSSLAYKLERWKCLARSPKKLVNYVKYLHSARRSSTVNYLPIKLDIENVSRCNFYCTMCQVSEWKNYRRANDMSLEEFKKLIDQQYGIVEIKLQGMGEPTLGGKTYFEMIKYARSKNIWVRTVTNASLLHGNEIYKKLIDADPNEVQISIDGAAKETFEKIRRGSNFERVTSNCKLINAYCKEKGVQKTKMWVVVQRDNVNELSQLVDLSSELGFSSMVFSLNLTDWGQEMWREKNNQVTIEDKINLDQAYKLIEQGRSKNLRVSFWNITSKYSTETPAKLCPWPFERAYVSSDMRVVPCCMIANPDVLELGDAHNFTSHWNGNQYEEFRKAHLDGNIPKVCRGCYKLK